MNPWVQIALGLVALVVGADLMVRGAVWVALRAGLSKMVVGLTLVAFGTSAPELVVSITAAMRDQSDTALGTVLGSNLANIGLIIGVSATIKAIGVVGGRIAFESNYLLAATALTIPPFLFFDGIGRAYAAVMVGLIVLFTLHILVRQRAQTRRQTTSTREPGTPLGWAINIALILIGGVGLMYGGDWLPTGAATLAEQWGMPRYLVSMLIVGVGTSLPELATSALAAAKGHPEISLGNVIGSNIFNIGMVLGITGLIHPLAITDSAAQAPSMIVGVVFAVALVALLRGAGQVPRLAGVGLLVAYGAVMTWEVLRSS